MKYMGSKRAMLANGLGAVFRNEALGRSRIVDLFAGSAAVSWFASSSFDVPVVAVDLQEYSRVLADSVVSRTRAMNPVTLVDKWMRDTKDQLSGEPCYKLAHELAEKALPTLEYAERARQLCAEQESGFDVTWSAYGGYYLSPLQAVTLDAMRACIPHRNPGKNVCLAATVIATSMCSASPGHTAQPFSPAANAAKFLRRAWARDPLQYAADAVRKLALTHARVKGEACVDDAVRYASKLQPSDLVFVDPPYSGVHYSRFYHVLETVARGKRYTVSGSGRYPPVEERPGSEFSRKSQSKSAISSLLDTIANVSCRAILTYPMGNCSNGLSGDYVLEHANRYFAVTKSVVQGRFSTLGGNNGNRPARTASAEQILVLHPR